MPAPLTEERASIYLVVCIPWKAVEFPGDFGLQAGFTRCGCCVMPVPAHIVNITPDRPSVGRSAPTDLLRASDHPENAEELDREPMAQASFLVPLWEPTTVK